MATDAAIVRLNLVVELLSECAQVDDFESLLLIADSRIRWILGFEQCTLAVRRGGGYSYWTVAREDDTLHPVAAEKVERVHAALLGKALETGTPESSGQPVSVLCAPLLHRDSAFGAICLSSQRGSYDYRDARFLFHIAQCISGTIVRLDLKHEADLESRRKDEFLALLSHELRNPLAPIVTAVQLLKLAARPELAKEVAIIERQTRHLLRLVEDLTDVSRLTRGSVFLRRAPTEIARVIALAIEMSDPAIQGRNHRLDVRVPSAGLVVSADDVRLAQVISNLLNNAARYTNPGGQISIAARHELGEVVIEVSDNGIGMSPETVPRVFDSFMRGPGAADRAQGGLGLGLSVVKALTALHGGTVSALSEGLGRGSRFTVRIPALADGPVEAIHTPVAVAFAHAKTEQRVLLVDDNEDAAEMLSEILRAAGHVVEVANDGPQALSIIGQFRPSVAVLDIGLPGMDGHELAERIHAHLGVDVPYLIALSGYGQERDRQRGRGAGFSCHLAKPVEAEALLQAIADGAISRAMLREARTAAASIQAATSPSRS